MQPAVDQLVRNLTLSNKKWTDIVGDILEVKPSHWNLSFH
jgi:hypothetical protein